jgi:hypothetical protein
MSNDRYGIPGRRPRRRREEDEDEAESVRPVETPAPTDRFEKLKFELRKQWFLAKAALLTTAGRRAAGAVGVSFLFFLFMATRGCGVDSKHRARGIAVPGDAAAIEAAIDENQRRAVAAVASDSKLTDAQKAQQIKLLEAAAAARKQAAGETSSKQTPFGTQK